MEPLFSKLSDKNSKEYYYIHEKATQESMDLQSLNEIPGELTLSKYLSLHEAKELIRIPSERSNDKALELQKDKYQSIEGDLSSILEGQTKFIERQGETLRKISAKIDSLKTKSSSSVAQMRSDLNEKMEFF